MPTKPVVEVPDLADLARQLKRAGDEFADALQAANLNAAQTVAAEIHARAPEGEHQGGGRIQPIKPSIRARATRTRGQVLVGGPATPHAAVHNYGGSIPRFHSAKRTSIPARPFIEPGMDAKAEAVEQAYDAQVDKVLSAAFPNR